MRATTLRIAICILLAGPASAQSPRDALENAAKALGVAGLKSIQYAGNGSAFTLGQNVNPNDPWPKVTLKAFMRTVDFGIPGYVEESLRVTPTGEQKQVQAVHANHAWNIVGNNPNPTPAAVQERLTQIWLTPHGFLMMALRGQPNFRSQREGGKRITLVTVTGPTKTTLTGTLDQNGVVERVETWIDNPVLGRMLVSTEYKDYKDFAGLKFPTRIVQRQGGHPTLDLTVTGAQPNVPLQITVPANVQQATAGPVRVETLKLTDGTWYLMGGTHHSVLVEFKDHVVVIEAPQNEDRANAVLAEVQRLVPGKPVRYVVNTHHHFDHSGGLRTFAARGVTVVTHDVNRPFYSRLFKGKFLTVGDKRVLTDGGRTLELHLIKSSPHSDGILMVYFPREKLLVEADVFTPPAPNSTPPPTSPATVNLLENVERLGLQVDSIAPIHGRLVPVTELRRAAGK
jgi:glyoxylase-like metal-dependent hydrolase (beta-lactamase superfamily II)